MNDKKIIAALGFTFTLLAASAHADTWQIGIFDESGRSPFIGDQKQSSISPMINYSGERFSYDGGKLEFVLSSGQGGEMYVAGQLRERQYYSANKAFEDNPQTTGMEDRESAFELGLGWQGSTTWGQWIIEGLSDATGTHQGFEISATYSYPQRIGRWLVEPAIGLQYQSAELVDYYHGVRASEVQDGRPAYSGDQAVNQFASLMAGYTVSARLLAIGGIEQIALDSGITDSPIVSQQHLRKVYLGLIYTF